MVGEQTSSAAEVVNNFTSQIPEKELSILSEARERGFVDRFAFVGDKGYVWCKSIPGFTFYCTKSGEKEITRGSTQTTVPDERQLVDVQCCPLVATARTTVERAIGQLKGSGKLSAGNVMPHENLFFLRCLVFIKACLTNHRLNQTEKKYW